VIPDRELPSSPESELSEKQLKVEAKTQNTGPLANSVDFSRNLYNDDVTEVKEGGQTEEHATRQRSSRNRCFLDTQYGIRRDGEQLMIGYSPVFIDSDANLTIKGTVFRDTEVL